MSSPQEDGEGVSEVHAIGISFGNSNSSIAHTTIDGKAEVIANEEGDRHIPSVLSYIDGEEFHGTQAKTQLVRNSKNTVAYFRDFLGKDFKHIDPSACHASAHPQQHGTDDIAFSIQDKASEEKNEVTVSEITTRHIRRLASSAADFLGRTIDAAVITVPTNFSEAQKKALAAASKAAGVQVLQMIAEPTAAVLAYDARAVDSAEVLKDKIVVVADLGGTRSDITVLASRGGMYSILATKHDNVTAGKQLDQVLIDHFAKEFVKKHKTDPREDPRSLAKLTLEAEATKKALSLGANASLSIESLANGVDFASTINRTRYELLAAKVFARFTRLVQDAVEAAELDVLDIDEVILSGGTSHTPRISTILAAIFPSSTRLLSPSTLPNAIDPSSLSARGAALQASLVSDYDAEDISQATHPMVTVTPHLAKTIGVMLVTDDTKRGVFHPLVSKETPVPCRRTIVLAAPKQGGDVLVKLCEADRAIKVTKQEAKTKTQTNGVKKDKNDSDSDDSDSDDDDDDLPDIREKYHNVTTTLAEAKVSNLPKASAGTKKNEVEIVLDITKDMGVKITARALGATATAGGGGKGGVRGEIKPA